MKSKIISILKKIIAVIPIIIAIVIVSAMVGARKGPEVLDVSEKAHAVRVIKTPATDVEPRAVAYGYAVPGQAWQAVAEVSGKVAEISPMLKKGALCREGTMLIRIDPAKYKLAIAQTEASIQSIKAQLSELDSQKENYKALLGIEQKSLGLSKKDLERQKLLLQKDTIAPSKYDKERVSYYTQLTKVQNLKNSLNLIPANRKSLQANLALNQVSLENARLDLEYTTVKAPFDCRITEVNVEKAQFVQKGQVIALADGTKTSEITAHIPIGKMMNLMRSDKQLPSLRDMNMSKLRKMLGITAVVRLKSGDVSVEWDAQVSRVDATIDPQTRTVGVIVSVEDSYEKVVLGARPPLTRNMFCEVELKGRVIPQTVIIPRSAFHDGYVYVADSKNRLKRKKITTDFPQTNFYAVKEGLDKDELLVVSDLIPAIEGMLLEPREDIELREKLIAEAMGKTEIK
ncbi:MAG: hypothetical protein GY795_42675 [Desulfobacterales bacterium]|nr:hypothetical protein [Desulfobacterales bacterium]